MFAVNCLELFSVGCLTGLLHLSVRVLITGAVPAIHRFLKADYRILVKAPGQPINATWLHYAIPGSVFLVFFAAVVPATYFLILWFLRRRLQVRHPPPTCNMWGLYVPWTRLSHYTLLDDRFEGGTVTLADVT